MVSRIKLLLDVAEGLNTLAASIQAVAEAMAGNEQSEPISQPTPADEPKSAVKAITLEQVRAVLAEKSQDGKTAQVRELIGKFGAGKLSEVAPERYAGLLAAAGEL
jgi:hypothetical protein